LQFRDFGHPYRIRQKQNDVSASLRVIDANRLTELELEQTTAKALPVTQMVVILDRSEPSLDGSAQRRVKTIEPHCERYPAPAGFVRL